MRHSKLRDIRTWRFSVKGRLFDVAADVLNEARAAKKIARMLEALPEGERGRVAHGATLIASSEQGAKAGVAIARSLLVLDPEARHRLGLAFALAAEGAAESTSEATVITETIGANGVAEVVGQ